MNITERQYKEKISLGQSGNALLLLIAICLVLFVSLAFLKAVWIFRYSEDKDLARQLFDKNVLGWFILPASFNGFLHKPWTLLTYMFAHDNFWRLLSSMLWLWCFGFIMQDLTGNNKIAPIFLYSSFGGAIAFLLAFNLIPSLLPQAPHTYAAGAAAGVMGVAVATTLVSPGYRIFPMIGGGIPLWIIFLVYAISDLATVSLGDTGGLIMHLAGAATGYLFIFSLRQGHDWSEWMNGFFDWVNNLFNPNKPKRNEPSIKENLFYKSTVKPFHKTPNVTQQRVDEILDKINQKGYHFLTDEEKDLLKRASKEDNI